MEGTFLSNGSVCDLCSLEESLEIEQVAAGSQEPGSEVLGEVPGIDEDWRGKRWIQDG